MEPEIREVQPVLSAPEMATSLRFFAQLGFVPLFLDSVDAPRYAVVRRGPIELHLQWAAASEWSRPGDRPVYRFRCGNVDEVYTAFCQSGVCPNGDGPWRAPANTPWQTREFHLRDPAGNGLQFYQPLPDNGRPAEDRQEQ